MTGWGTPTQPRTLADFTPTGTSPLNISRVGGQGGSAALGNNTPVSGSLYVTTWISPCRPNPAIDWLTCTYTTVGGGGSVARIGIYEAISETNPYPGTLLSGSASLDVTTPAAPFPILHTAAIPVRASWLYWLAFLYTGTSFIGRGVSVNGGAPFGYLFTAATAIPAASVIGLVVTGQTAASALPSTFPAGATPVTTAVIPAVEVHMSA